jgi:hypothetical protein
MDAIVYAEILCTEYGLNCVWTESCGLKKNVFAELCELTKCMG